MRILFLHNHYQQCGGEDAAFRQEKLILESRGHDVKCLTESNSSISGVAAKITAGLRATYSRRSRARVVAEIAACKPDVVHIHNVFPQLSPSVYYACKQFQIPVVQTLHNFRFICPNAVLFRRGQPCEQCVGKSLAWPGIAHACYRGSHSGTAAVAAMLTIHRWLGTWSTQVDAYIALSEFARCKFVAGGLPADRLFVKPNCLTPDPGLRTSSAGFGLYVGRLSVEKGVETLVAGWSQLQHRKLKIIGDGPLRRTVEAMQASNIEFLGEKRHGDVLEFIGKAAFLVMPSGCYENFPRVIVEAFSRGVPLLATRIGSTQEIIRDNCTGVLFRPGDAHELAEKAEWLFSHPRDVDRMSQAARSEFLEKYTAGRNYERLIEIYALAAAHARHRYAKSVAVPAPGSGEKQIPTPQPQEKAAPLPVDNKQ